MDTLAFNPGSYVTDSADSSRYYRSVYRVTGQSFDRTIVERVGQIENGRFVSGGDRGVTHRTTSNLREWK
jgi:hypothetical protein